MAGGAGEIELAAPRVEILLAVLVGLERAWIGRDFDVERLAARGERHIGGQRGHFIAYIGEGRFTIRFATLVQRQFKRDDFAFFRIEIGIVLTNADTLVRKTIGVALSVPEWLREQILAHVERELIGRELLFLLPLPAHVLIH